MSVNAYQNKKIRREAQKEQMQEIVKTNHKVFTFSFVFACVCSALTLAFLTFVLIDMYGYDMPYQQQLQLHIWLTALVTVLILAVFLGTCFMFWRHREMFQDDEKQKFVLLSLIVVFLVLIALCAHVVHSCYLDIVKNDFVVYTGHFFGREYHSNVVTLEDEHQTQVRGVNLSDDMYMGTVVYAKRSKICLEMNETLLYAAQES